MDFHTNEALTITHKRGIFPKLLAVVKATVRSPMPQEKSF